MKQPRSDPKFGSPGVARACTLNRPTERQAVLSNRRHTQLRADPIALACLADSAALSVVLALRCAECMRLLRNQRECERYAGRGDRQELAAETDDAEDDAFHTALEILCVESFAPQGRVPVAVVIASE